MRASLAAVLAFVAATSLTVAHAEDVAAQKTIVSIGTGRVTGVYFPTGGAICRLVNRNRARQGIRCLVESTAGSVANLDAIRRGGLELGVAQSDWQFHAFNGSSRYAGEGPFENLRSVFSVYPEPFSVVARADSNIKNIQDLKGKRVNIGDPGSGTRATMMVVLAALGWTNDDFSLVTELRSSDQPRALCDNKVDAIVFVGGHPNGLVPEAMNACDAVLVNVAGDAIGQLINNNTFYRLATIPGGMYRGNRDDVRTFGVGATVVRSTDVPDDVIYTIVSAVFDDLDGLRRQHPAFGALRPDEMVEAGLTAPLHGGAARCYGEQGWLP